MSPTWKHIDPEELKRLEAMAGEQSNNRGSLVSSKSKYHNQKTDGVYIGNGRAKFAWDTGVHDIYGYYTEEEISVLQGMNEGSMIVADNGDVVFNLNGKIKTIKLKDARNILDYYFTKMEKGSKENEFTRGYRACLEELEANLLPIREQLYWCKKTTVPNMPQEWYDQMHSYESGLSDCFNAIEKTKKKINEEAIVDTRRCRDCGAKLYMHSDSKLYCHVHTCRTFPIYQEGVRD